MGCFWIEYRLNLLPSSKLGPRIDAVPALLCLGRCYRYPVDPL